MEQNFNIGESSPWNMCKVLLFGDVKVGKTALCKSMIGTSFAEKEAIAGLTTSTVVAENGIWTECKTPKMELASNIPVGKQIMLFLDFEGQSSFREFNNLFITSYGVCIVVFNMLDILDDNKKENCLTELSHWINTIVYHTFDAKTDKTAPVFLVGTHKDKVNGQARHQYISDVIEERFKYNPVWPHIVESTNLSFFPVNNNLDRMHSYIPKWLGSLFYTSNELDDGLGNLRSEIERVIKDSECMKQPKPLAWFQAIDELTASTKSFLTLKEASDIATANGVEQDSVPLFLSFLNKMGYVLWLDEEGLRDVVILDVMTFFVEPASLIVCSHISNSSDSTTHLREKQLHYLKQLYYRKKDPISWDQMTLRGTVSRQYLDILLGKLVPTGNIPVVRNLMLKFGLMVKDEVERAKAIESEQSIDPMVSEEYLVPSLLPRTVVDPCVFEDEIWKKNVKQWKSCYFVFCTRTNYLHSLLRFSQLKYDCFFPKELMGRLIGKVVKWTSESDGTSAIERPSLYRDYAVFFLEQQHLRLVCISELNCIRLDIEGEHPLPVYNRICELIKECVKECMGSLVFFTALPLSPASSSLEDLVLLSIDVFRTIQSTGRSLIVNGYDIVDRKFIFDNYSAWFPDANCSSCEGDGIHSTVSDKTNAPEQSITSYSNCYSYDEIEKTAGELQGSELEATPALRKNKVCICNI